MEEYSAEETEKRGSKPGKSGALWTVQCMNIHDCPQVYDN